MRRSMPSYCQKFDGRNCLKLGPDAVKKVGWFEFFPGFSSIESIGAARKCAQDREEEGRTACLFVRAMASRIDSTPRSILLHPIASGPVASCNANPVRVMTCLLVLIHPRFHCAPRQHTSEQLGPTHSCGTCSIHYFGQYS